MILLKPVLDFEPKRVFHYFEELSKIPRGSYNERQVSDYLASFAKERGLDYTQDKFMNIVIRKPGTKGYEHLPTVILQGHMDMVNEKNGDKEHDFDQDPLTLLVKEDYIYADGTTLGADNGIAVAMALAILESDEIPHPPLEAVFTVEEEVGLTGAANLEGSLLSGKYLINIDSEEEGEFLVSCAGGARTKLRIPVKRVPASKSSGCKLSVKGLKGGHSGMDIIKGRGNSNKILGRLLFELSKSVDFELSFVSGGSKMNAIPREAQALLAVDSENEKLLSDFTEKWNGILKNELFGKDEGVLICCEKEERPDSVLCPESKTRLLHALVLAPNGIHSMSASMENLVESSVNLGVLTTEEESVALESCHRSSVDSLLDDLLNGYQALAEAVSGTLTTDSRYCGWQYNPNSELREHFKKVYKDMTGTEAKLVAIHAGVECGLFGEKIEGLDMISLGPNMYDVHTPDEHLSISSTKRVYDFLLEVLRRFNEI